MKVAFSILSISLVLFCTQVKAGARHRDDGKVEVGKFEVVINEEILSSFNYYTISATVEPLANGPMNITQARIQNVQAQNDSDTVRTLIKCVFRSSAPTDYISPEFDLENPLSEPFPDAETIICVPNNWFYRGNEGDKAWQLPDSPEAAVYVEDSSQRFKVHMLSVKPRFSPFVNEWEDRRYTKVAFLNVQEPQTVCQINIRWEESIFLRVGESWEDEIGVDIALLNCFVDWKGLIVGRYGEK